jgi:hypothetical protein
MIFNDETLQRVLAEIKRRQSYHELSQAKLIILDILETAFNINIDLSIITES